MPPPKNALAQAVGVCGHRVFLDCALRDDASLEAAKHIMSSS